MKGNLDFLVIGAAKAGTTTLFELAKEHPQIAMPREKEVPFFSDDEVYKKGLNWYLDTYFADAAPSKKWGTVTPQYMLGKDDVDPKKTAQRIKKEFPGIKLVAILRDPVERAYSHYRMLSQRGVLSGSFREEIDAMLTNKNFGGLRSEKIGPANTFLLGSEYGRILSYYFEIFDKDQILVLFTEDLKHKPEMVLEGFFNFIDVDNTYKPVNLGREFRKGGSKAKIKFLTPGFLYKIPFVKRTWNKLVPQTIRKRVEYFINLWNIKADNSRLSRSDSVYIKLSKFYKSDTSKLEEILGKEISWTL